jgi:transketolase
MSDRRQHDRMANAIRALSMDAVEAAKSGHPGLPMGCADIATVLFRDHLRFDPAAPHWPDRDRFVLSAGHGSMLLYSVLHLTGYADFPLSELKRFRQLGARTAGHPEFGHGAGVETTTGPLGQGIANAVGMALAERLLNARFGDRLVDHRTYVLASDGDLMEGISHEAIGIAGHLGLSRLVVIWDDNGISIDGPLSMSDSTDQLKRFEASGWRTEAVDGHDPEALSAAIGRAKTGNRPTLIAARTTIGYGAPTKAGKSSSHGSPLGTAEVEGARKALGWPHAPFEIPDDIRNLWKAAAERGAAARAEWETRAARVAGAKRKAFERAMAGEIPPAFTRAVRVLKEKAATEKAEIATRKTSETVIEAIADALPSLVSGSADLTGSNNTKTRQMAVVKPGDFAGGFIHWGIREHGMAAAMNGMALHGGVIPASGTFLVFADYLRPSLRLAALMGQRVIHVLTHDSIGVGEDGPTHQPVEHLAALRAIPNLDVFRPCDLAETIEAWDLAIRAADRPTVLALTRQNLPQLRQAHGPRNLSATGAYELRAAEGGKADVSIFASGSEVSLAVQARALLAAQGVKARVVSVPCLDLLMRQPKALRQRIIGRAKVKVAVEAAIRMGWDAVIGADGIFVGMEGFGASGPAKEVFAHFGITAEKVAEAALARIRQ